MQMDPNQRLFAYVGSWTSGRNGAGSDGGLHVYVVDGPSGRWTHVQSLEPDLNAGYLVVSPDRRHLYVVDERADAFGRRGTGGTITAYGIDTGSGRLKRKNRVPSLGAFPAHAGMDPGGRRLVVANHAGYEPVIRVHDRRLQPVYDDSTVALFSILPDGSLSDATDVAVLDRGPAPGWMGSTGYAAMFLASPHAHSVTWDPSGTFILVCDKGGDRIHSFRVTENGLNLSGCFAAPERTSPRHSAFHPILPFVFVTNELVPTLSMYRFDRVTGQLAHCETVPTVCPPPSADTTLLAADVQVHPTLPIVYASTRRSDTIAAFHFDATIPKLELIQMSASGGSTPRTIAIDPQGECLFACNQDSGGIARFLIDQSTGHLVAVGNVVDVPKPVCIAFAWVGLEGSTPE